MPELPHGDIRSVLLEVEGADHQFLERGDLTLVPHGEGHRLSSEPGTPGPRVHDLPHEHVSDRYAILRYGGGGAVTNLVCGAVRFDHPAAHHLVTLLPRVIHVAPREGASQGLSGPR